MRTTGFTYCRICEVACGLVVDSSETGAPIRLRPDKQHPVSHGFACAKGTRFFETARSSDRVLHPMRKSPSGSFTRVGWSEVLAEVGARLRAIRERHGPHSIAIYFGNPLAFNFFGTLALAGFMKALETRNVYSAGSQDCNNKFAAAQLVHGSPLIHPIPDFAHTELAVLFGTNPAISQSSFVHLEGGTTQFDSLQEKGVPIVWIDPRHSESAQRWGEHLPIKPGTDAYLLLALIHCLRDLPYDQRYATGLERVLSHASTYPPERVAQLTGLSAEQIVKLAARIRASRATAFHMSVGVNQGGFGTLSYVLLQALVYLTDNFDKRGGSLVHPLARPFAQMARRFGIGTRRVYSRVGNYPSTLDTLPGGILADEILTPGAEQVRALIVVAGDPLRTMPNTERLRQASRNLECLIVIDIFANETSQEAHYLLPATSWLERFDVATTTTLFQQAPFLQWSDRIMEPMGEARHELQILSDIAQAMGGRIAKHMLPFRLISTLRVDRTAGLLMAPLRWGNGSRVYGIPVPVPKPGNYLSRGLLTPDRKLHFGPPELESEYQRLDQSANANQSTAGFVLVGRRRRLGHNGWLHGGSRDGNAEAVAWLHPSDADAMGLHTTGGIICIQNSSGRIEILAVPHPSVARGTIVMPHGIPGANLNVLVPTEPTFIERLSGQHQMTGIPVEVRVVVHEAS